jgi:hypothetical protein
LKHRIAQIEDGVSNVFLMVPLKFDVLTALEEVGPIFHSQLPCEIACNDRSDPGV